MTIAKASQINKFNKKTIIKIPYKHNHCLDTSQIHFRLRDLLTMEEKHMHVACTNPSLPHKKDSVDVCLCAATYALCIQIDLHFKESFLPTACLVPRLLSEISFCVDRPWRKSNIVIKPHMQPDCSLSYRTGCLCDFFAMVNG